MLSKRGGDAGHTQNYAVWHRCLIHPLCPQFDFLGEHYSFSGGRGDVKNCLNERGRVWGGDFYIEDEVPSFNYSLSKHLLSTCQCIQHKASGWGMKRYDIVLIWGFSSLGCPNGLEQGPLEGAEGSPEPDKAWHNLPGNLRMPSHPVPEPCC